MKTKSLKIFYTLPDSLEDIVGRDEMERVAQISQERAKGGKSIGALSMAINDGPKEPRQVLEPRTPGVGIDIATSPVLAGPNPTEPMAYGYFATSVEDEVVPWSDTPQVSRFGPISRRGTSITRPSKPSQTLAAMDDETNPTAVVRHSKQMSKQLPPTASLILQVRKSGPAEGLGIRGGTLKILFCIRNMHREASFLVGVH